MAMNNVVTRSISGIVYIAVIVGAIFIGEIGVQLLTAIFAAFASAELSKLFSANNPQEPSVGPMVKTIDFLAPVVIALAPIAFSLSRHAMSGLVVTSAIVLAIALIRAVAALFDRSEHPLRNIIETCFKMLYIGAPLACLGFLATAAHGRDLVLLMFIMIWLNDTGAFCFGITLGRNRLCERLSPKKSWEGFWGGMLCSIGAGLAYALIFSAGASRPVWQWIVMGLLVSVFSTWGDLFESLIKRTMHTKDSGHLIPGHGGILDRIDSLLFTAPAISAYICILHFIK